MPCRVKITLKDGRVLEQETNDYEGFFTRPMSWETAVQKFNKIATPNKQKVSGPVLLKRSPIWSKSRFAN